MCFLKQKIYNNLLKIGFSFCRIVKISELCKLLIKKRKQIDV